MLVLWWVLVLSARCFGADEIPLDRAEQSSTYSNSDFIAANAIDSDLNTKSATEQGNPVWLRVYFQNSSDVGEVVIEKGRSGCSLCIYTVSVYDSEVGTVCGTYTGKYGFYSNETVQCGGKRGDSVRLERTGGPKPLYVFEIKVYEQGKY